MNLNIHFHSLVLEGVYTRPTPTARPVFHRLPPPTDADIAALLTRLHRRVRRLLARCGRLPEPVDGGANPFAAEEPLFATAVAASRHGRVALGPRAGHPLRRLRSAAAAALAGPRCARLDGFSLHADVTVPAHRRDRLEHLCRSLLRPPLALERLTETTGGELLSQLRRPWSDGSTALLLDPLELLERLAATGATPVGTAPRLAVPESRRPRRPRTRLSAAPFDRSRPSSSPPPGGPAARGAAPPGAIPSGCAGAARLGRGPRAGRTGGRNGLCAS